MLQMQSIYVTDNAAILDIEISVGQHKSHEIRE